MIRTAEPSWVQLLKRPQANGFGMHFPPNLGGWGCLRFAIRRFSFIDRYKPDAFHVVEQRSDYELDFDY
jgi:hypothetical protein